MNANQISASHHVISSRSLGSTSLIANRVAAARRSNDASGRIGARDRFSPRRRFGARVRSVAFALSPPVDGRRDRRTGCPIPAVSRAGWTDTENACVTVSPFVGTIGTR